MKIIKNIVLILWISLATIGCEYITDVEDISDKEITILAPVNNANLNTVDVDFAWENLEGAEQYRLQIATPNFLEATRVLTDSVVNVTRFSKTIDAGSYEWRLRGENSEYATAYKSQIFTVNANIVDISNEQVMLSSPEDNATLKTTETLNFSWEAIGDADEYILEIVSPNFNNVSETIENVTITELNFSKSNLAVGNYEWRVKAKNTKYETNYTTRNFMIEE